MTGPCKRLDLAFLNFFILLPILLMANTEIRPSGGIKVKCVLISMYEFDSDKPGEFQFFRKAERLRKTHEFPLGQNDIWSNDAGLFALTIGIGAAKAAATTMAFGLDPRFDLSQSYFLIAGIAGINPRFGSLASVAWADYCIDGDLAHEIDAREIPEDWSTGIFPLGTFAPYHRRSKEAGDLFHNDEMYGLNRKLSDWAYTTTQQLDLSDLDNPELESYRTRYRGFPEAQRPPFVLKGDNLSATRYWHGKMKNEWAERWVDFWTEGKGKFVTASMEDAGTLRALVQLARTGRVDWKRILLLRSASNFSMQAPERMTPSQSLRGEDGSGESLFPGYLASLQSLQRAGSKVINEIIAKWEHFNNSPPQ